MQVRLQSHPLVLVLAERRHTSFRPPATTRPHTRSVNASRAVWNPRRPLSLSFLSFFFPSTGKGPAAQGRGVRTRAVAPAARPGPAVGRGTDDGELASGLPGRREPRRSPLASRLSPPIAYLLCCSRWSYHSVGSLVGRMPSKVKKLPNLTSQIPSSLYFVWCGARSLPAFLFCEKIVTGFLIGLARHGLISPKCQSGYLVKYSH